VTKKQIAAIVVALLTVLGSLAAGARGLSVGSEGVAAAKALAERVQALEVREREREKREVAEARWRERIEEKIDRLVERVR
jgi:hypothetical protein